MRTLHTIVVLVLASIVSAQTPIGEKPPEVNDPKANLRKRILDMRTAMREGRVQNLNVYVKVWLKNGNRLKGVVKNGRFVELHDGLAFVTSAERQDKGAGMRVWYTAGTTSYVFLPYSEIKRYKIGTELSDEQVKTIELTLAKEFQETQENYRRVQEERRRALAKKNGEFVEQPITEEQSKLLKEFPPEEGWGEEKIKQLKMRRITLGVYPDEKERRFETNFDAWKKAVETKKANEDAYKQRGKDPLPKPGGESQGSGSGKTGSGETNNEIKPPFK